MLPTILERAINTGFTLTILPSDKDNPGGYEFDIELVKGNVVFQQYIVKDIAEGIHSVECQFIQYCINESGL